MIVSPDVSSISRSMTNVMQAAKMSDIIFVLWLMRMDNSGCSIILTLHTSIVFRSSDLWDISYIHKLTFSSVSI